MTESTMTVAAMVAVGGLTAVAAAMVVPVATLLVQVLLAFPRRRPDDGIEGTSDKTGPRRLAVLMPAHDEAAGISRAIETIRPQLAPSDRLLVVADNCTDATADVARAAGAMVVERVDIARRGKGFALDHGVRALAKEPPDVVVIVDADCVVESTSLRQLVDQVVATGRPAQAHYRMLAPEQPSLRQRISAFAWIVRNTARPTGWHRLGWPCQLMGTGMAFPWALLRDASLASGHLVEDLELGISLACSGHPPRFCPAALVTSTFPTDDAAATAQRTRWEHGHIAILVGAAPRLLATGFTRVDAALVAMALDLAVPPIASLALASGGLTVVGVAVGAAGFSWWPATLATSSLVMLVVGVGVAWWRFGRETVSALDLASAPIYVLRKLPIYLRLLWSRQVAWVRTKR